MINLRDFLSALPDRQVVCFHFKKTQPDEYFIYSYLTVGEAPNESAVFKRMFSGYDGNAYVINFRSVDDRINDTVIHADVRVFNI